LTAPATVPASLAGSVVAVGGLSQDHDLRPKAAPSDGFRVAPPCSAYYGQKIATRFPKVLGAKRPYAVCGYSPKQLRGAYGLTDVARHGFLGQGQTVAITDAYDSPTMLKDLNTFSRRHGLPTMKPGQYVDMSPKGLSAKPNSPSCGDWYGEQTLDVEAVHEMAPDARIVYDGSTGCGDASLLVTVHQVVDNHRAQIINNSWGDAGDDVPASLRTAYHQLFVEAALKGIGVYFSSGDDGDEATTIGKIEVDWPGEDTMVTAVGGTNLAVGRHNQYLSETGWGEGRSVFTDGAWVPTPPGDFWDGSGGGTSAKVMEPWYQHGVVPFSLSHALGENGFANGNRVVPDVAAVAAPATGMLVGQTQSWLNGSVHYGEYRIGGTSVSSPLFAGMMAIADQIAGHPHGFVNPALYSVAGGKAFHDIVPARHPSALVRIDFNNSQNGRAGHTVSTRVSDHDGSLKTARGYDDVTGVGSPNGGWFFHILGRLK
jgi:subtilase family serine protease